MCEVSCNSVRIGRHVQHIRLFYKVVNVIFHTRTRYRKSDQKRPCKFRFLPQLIVARKGREIRTKRLEHGPGDICGMVDGWMDGISSTRALYVKDKAPNVSTVESPNSLTDLRENI